MKLSKGFTPLEIRECRGKLKQNKFLTGFTLIELIVVMAVFLFIIGAAISIFISIVRHQKIIIAEQELLNQTSYIMEYMSKALRMAKKAENSDCIPSGYIYKLTERGSSTGFYTGVKFINQIDGDACWEFYLDNTDPANPVLKELKNSTNDSQAVALTSTNFKINSIRFGVNGRDGSTGIDGAKGIDGVQPRITIYLDIKAQGDENQPIKKIQTTVSQRNLNTQ